MKYFTIHDISLTLHRGEPITQIFFADSKHKGVWMTPKEVLDKVESLGCKHVILRGEEPLNQHMKNLIGLCWMLKMRHKCRVIMESSAERFNQLLFINVHSFVIHPHKEKTSPIKLERYIENATAKRQYNPHLFKDLTYTHKQNKWAGIRYVEMVFDIRSPGDCQYALDTVLNYHIRQQRIKVMIRPQPSAEFTMEQITKEWLEVKNKFDYEFLYLMEIVQ